ncbi:MAG TPA: HNH endonuclease [Archangium sp.]|nr:HNH endonuclease [Archangium sp.]
MPASAAPPHTAPATRVAPSSRASRGRPRPLQHGTLLSVPRGCCSTAPSRRPVRQALDSGIRACLVGDSIEPAPPRRPCCSSGSSASPPQRRLSGRYQAPRTGEESKDWFRSGRPERWLLRVMGSVLPGGDRGRMQLVKFEEHRLATPHTGGMAIWGGGYP